jgi:hypothetical protein
MTHGAFNRRLNVKGCLGLLVLGIVFTLLVANFPQAMDAGLFFVGLIIFIFVIWISFKGSGGGGSGTGDDIRSDLGSGGMDGSRDGD